MTTSTSNAGPADGGPAFPQAREIGLMNFKGASLRDYFAARAPDVPEWFAQVWREKPLIPPLLLDQTALLAHPRAGDLSPQQKRDLAAWLADGTYDPDDAIAEIAREVRASLDENRATIERMTRESEIGMFFAWRYYYADEMLRMRRTV